MFSSPFGYLCECGNTHCKATIALTEQSSIDFSDYCGQRTEYWLISKSCPDLSKLSMDKMVIDGEDYYIFDLT